MIAAFFDNPAAMILLTGMLVGSSAAVLGCFLVLRGNAMLSDAISHSIVFGIIVVWMMTGAQSGPLQLVGAAATGVLTVVASEALARSRLVRMDAAIGLVFPALFAAGVLLINLNARNVHIDVDMVLLGEIGFVWLETTQILGLRVPVAVVTLAAMLAVNLAFVGLLWKELKIATFDPALAAALGFAPGVLFYALLTLTSATAVASFDAVGAILFIAFVIVPPATAILLTQVLGRMVMIAVALSVSASISGYFLAVRWDVSIGGMMATMTGVFFALVLMLAPRQGLVARRLALRAERLDLDCLAMVVHLAAHSGTPDMLRENTEIALTGHLRWPAEKARAVILRGLDRGLIRREGTILALTEKGAGMAQALLSPANRPGTA